MKAIIQTFAGLFMYSFILANLFGAGLGLTVREVIEPLKKKSLVLLALISNFVLIPGLAYGLSVLLKADYSMQAGIIIIAFCAGAPFLPRLITMAKGNMAGAIGIMVLLMAATVVIVPVVLPFVIPGLSVNPLAIAKPLIALMLLPIVLGLTVKAWKSNIAVSIKPAIDKISSISLVGWIFFALIIDYKIIISAYGTGIYNLMFWFTIGTLLVGYMFGGTSKQERFVVMMGSGARNIPAALLIAISNFSDHKVITVVLIGSLVQFIILFLIAFIHGRNEASKAPRQL